MAAAPRRALARGVTVWHGVSQRRAAPADGVSAEARARDCLVDHPAVVIDERVAVGACDQRETSARARRGRGRGGAARQALREKTGGRNGNARSALAGACTSDHDSPRGALTSATVSVGTVLSVTTCACVQWHTWRSCDDVGCVPQSTMGRAATADGASTAKGRDTLRDLRRRGDHPTRRRRIAVVCVSDQRLERRDAEDHHQHGGEAPLQEDPRRARPATQRHGPCARRLA